MDEHLLHSLLSTVTVPQESSSIHTGDTDSSEDEDNRDFENQKYNECGRKIKHILTSSSPPVKNEKIQTKTKSTSWNNKVTNENAGSYEPLFGIRVVNPLVATDVLEKRMAGREFVPFHKIKLFVKNTKEKDWVVVGVLVGKSATKTTRTGKPFSVWTLSDLRVDLKTVSVFLFVNAHEELWKTEIGMVVGILNPSILEMKDDCKDLALLSINNYQLVMILGKSKDLGTCKSMKKNGERCNAFVNNNICEFCVFHVKSEYLKSSKRSDLQSSFSGGGLNALRNKVLGKNQVFYAGKMYSAIPAKNNKLKLKDEKRLKVLSGIADSQQAKRSNTLQAKQAEGFELDANQNKKDSERLKQLGVTKDFQTFETDHSQVVSVTNAKLQASNLATKLKGTACSIELNPETIKEKDTVPKSIPKSYLSHTPVLTSTSKTEVNLNVPVYRKETIAAKKKAVAWVQNNGPITKQDPNNVRGKGKKRTRDEHCLISEEKKAKIQKNEFFSDRFKKMIATTSVHANLLEDLENERQQEYFKRLEMKERMEEKMQTTYKVPCKAVKCLKCKYTNFSASDLCKVEKHPLKVFDAFKRFFKCGNCGNRTVSLVVVPTTACKNCGSGKWERTSMMKEYKDGISAPTLSIRGGEQTFLNSVVTNTSLDLLVPEY